MRPVFLDGKIGMREISKIINDVIIIHDTSDKPNSMKKTLILLLLVTKLFYILSVLAARANKTIKRYDLHQFVSS